MRAISLVLACTLVIAAFSATDASGAEDTAHKVTIGAGAEGTASYTLATGLAKVATKGGMQASVVPEARADALVRLLIEGKLHFAVADSAILGMAYAGPEKAVALRLVMRGAPQAAVPVAEKDAPKKNVHDVYLATHKSASDEEVKRFLQSIWDDAESLEPINPAANRWKHDLAVSAEMTIPYHPAAVEFYNRKGVWSAQADEAQQRLLASNP